MDTFTKQGILLSIENVSLMLPKNKPNGNLIIRELSESIQNIVRPGMTQGQVVALLGPSGIGKTQLFKMLAGLETPDSGRILINVSGNDSSDSCTEVKAGQVGVVAQHYPLFRRLKVLENLMLAGRQAGMSRNKAKERATELLVRFSLGDHLYHYPKELSGGQRQRVAIAQQMMCSEYFLLMDEPYSGLDPLMKHEVSNLVRQVSTMNELSTIIVTTHDISMAVADADTIWVLGYDNDPATGTFKPGARVQKKYDLIERGLAWQPNIKNLPQFTRTVREIEEVFTKLK